VKLLTEIQAMLQGGSLSWKTIFKEKGRSCS